PSRSSPRRRSSDLVTARDVELAAIFRDSELLQSGRKRRRRTPDIATHVVDFGDRPRPGRAVAANHIEFLADQRTAREGTAGGHGGAFPPAIGSDGGQRNGGKDRSENAAAAQTRRSEHRNLPLPQKSVEQDQRRQPQEREEPYRIGQGCHENRGRNGRIDADLIKT